MSLQRMIAALTQSVDKAGGYPGPPPVEQVLTQVKKSGGRVNQRPMSDLNDVLAGLPTSAREYVQAQISKGLPAVVKVPVNGTPGSPLRTVSVVPVDLAPTRQGVQPVGATGPGAPIERETALAYNAAITPPPSGNQIDALLQRERSRAAALHGSRTSGISASGGQDALVRAGQQVVDRSAMSNAQRAAMMGVRGAREQGARVVAQNQAANAMSGQQVRPAGLWANKLFGRGGSGGSMGGGSF